jgi:hypothetical protein
MPVREVPKVQEQAPANDRIKCEDENTVLFSPAIASATSNWPQVAAQELGIPVQELRRRLKVCAAMHNDLVDWLDKHPRS